MHYLRVATKEVKEPMNPEILKKVTIESEGFLYSESRVKDGQRFAFSRDMEDYGILTNQGIIIHTPLIKRKIKTP